MILKLYDQDRQMQCFLIMLDLLAGNLMQRKKYDEASKALVLSLDCIKGCNIKYDSILIHQYHLGLVHEQLGRSGDRVFFQKALKFYEQMLVTTKQSNPPSRLMTIALMEGVARVNARLGQHQKAQKLSKLVTVKKLAICGYLDEPLSTTYNDMAILAVKAGQHEDAVRFMRLAYEIRNVTYKGNQLEIAPFLDNLGLALAISDDLDSAVDAFTRVLRMQEELRGADSPSLVGCHMNLALALEMKKEFDQAAHHYDRSIQLEEGTLESSFKSIRRQLEQKKNRKYFEKFPELRPIEIPVWWDVD